MKGGHPELSPLHFVGRASTEAADNIQFALREINRTKNVLGWDGKAQTRSRNLGCVVTMTGQRPWSQGTAAGGQVRTDQGCLEVD